MMASAVGLGFSSGVAVVTGFCFWFRFQLRFRFCCGFLPLASWFHLWVSFSSPVLVLLLVSDFGFGFSFGFGFAAGFGFWFRFEFRFWRRCWLRLLVSVPEVGCCSV